MFALDLIAKNTTSYYVATKRLCPTALSQNSRILLSGFVDAVHYLQSGKISPDILIQCFECAKDELCSLPTFEIEHDNLYPHSSDPLSESILLTNYIMQIACMFFYCDSFGSDESIINSVVKNKSKVYNIVLKGLNGGFFKKKYEEGILAVSSFCNNPNPRIVLACSSIDIFEKSSSLFKD